MTTTAQTTPDEHAGLERKLDAVFNHKDEAPVPPREETESHQAEHASQTGLKAWLGKHKKALIVVAIILGILVAMVAFLGFYTFSVAQELIGQTQVAKATGQIAYQSFKEQNLPQAESELKKLNEELTQIKSSYTKLGFYQYVPFVSKYYVDGNHGLEAAQAGLNAGLKTVEAVTPYADVLGFGGEKFEGGTAEDRVKLILQTLEKITPQLDAIAADLEVAQSHLAEIDPQDYPESVKGTPVRASITQGKELVAGANKALTDFRPIIEKIPEIAGANQNRKKYLVLFQNDNELRPTGGFLTAYAVIFIEDGKVTQEKSDDIYELDKKFSERIEIPEALGKYLTTEKYWNLRDMNTSPDFKISMEQFFEHYQNVRGEPDNIDGIIAVDTELLTAIMEAIGPVEVPGYGTFTAENDPRCDCPKIIYVLSEIITKPTPYHREDRKGILGPLMSALLHKIYSSPRTFMADLFRVGLESIEGRHLQAYLFEDQAQQAIEAVNAGGRMELDPNAQDFLAIVNANLGGAKSNLFVNYDVMQEVSAPENGQITKTVTITYKNSRAADNCNLEAGLLCLNSTLRDWTRLYLPKGSKLVDAQGFTQETKEYDEGDFSVIDGFFILEPKSQATLKITYTVPYTDSDYKVKLWKQGGVDPIPVIMDVTGGQEEVLLNKDQVYQTTF